MRAAVCVQATAAPVALVEGAVYQLHAPGVGEPNLDVVFFHGLQIGDYKKAWLTTWQADNDMPNGSWPSRLLQRAFPRRASCLCHMIRQPSMAAWTWWPSVSS